MMIKKSLLLFFIVLILAGFVSAQGEKVNIEMLKEEYAAGEDITLKVSLLDSQNNPIEGDINLFLESASKTKNLEITVQANKIIDVNLADKEVAGYWSATADYNGIKSKALFQIASNENVKFELVGDTLIVTNVGNVPYRKEIQILVGDTPGIKSVDLNVGESANYRIIAPDGNYKIVVSVDGATKLSNGEVSLTGNAIGILDNKLEDNSPITSGAQSKGSVFTTIFIFTILGAAILLGIERTYKYLSKK